ncbi:MAG: hypothetical protein A2X84_14095 [Desulfuromonadaceae bacterium GWC2_58_13]|nr:MAG: hypothetical protein A2X84_14095 [Desulfuromonadaceae bacterium GWC2_58_13]
MKAPRVWLCCGVVKAEMEELKRRGSIDGTLLFLDSMLHMNPARLEKTLTATLEQLSTPSADLVLVYGDCSARMLDLVRRFRVGRINCTNCAQFLVGRDRYRQLMNEEAFLILPEWAARWEHIMKNELGLNQRVARDLMGENRRILVYLDTGLTPVPEQELAGFSTYSGLPWRVEAVPLDIMRQELLEALARINPVEKAGDSP